MSNCEFLIPYCRYPVGYPESPIEWTDFGAVEGELSEDSLQYLKEVVLREAERMKGQPAIFAIVGKLEQSRVYNTVSSVILCYLKCFYQDSFLTSTPYSIHFGVGDFFFVFQI